MEQLLLSIVENLSGFQLLESVLPYEQMEFQQYGSTFLHKQNGYLFLFQPYLPLMVSDTSIGFVDSYYKAYQRLYSRRNTVLNHIKEQFPLSVPYRGLYKNLMVALKIGRVLRNTLIWIKPFGTFFCVEVIDLYNRPLYISPILSSDIRPECKTCIACQKKCPSKAICDSGFIRSKCLRQWQCDFADFENDYSRHLLGNRILGCNTCQIYCPLNHGTSVKTLRPDDLYRSLFQLDTLAIKTCSPGFKDGEYVAVFGRNYAKPMKILSFVLNAMLNDDPFQHIDTIQQCLNMGKPSAKPLLKKYIQLCQREGKL